MKFLSTIILCFVLASTYKLYDEKGYYKGKIERRSYGTYRVYDKKGNFKGTIEEGSFNKFRFYDTKGRYKKTLKIDK